VSLPPDHPFWTSWLVILPVSVLSGVIVYFGAERLAAPALLARRGPSWVKRRGAVGCAVSAGIVGMLTAVLYGWISRAVPGLAAPILALASTAIVAMLTALAILARRPQGGRGSAELVVLIVLWGIGYGWLIPLVRGAV
jgi:hypothetical protein